MPLDPGIILSQIQPKSYVDQLGEAARAKALMGQTTLQNMVIDQQKKSIADQQKLSDLYRGNIGADGQINRAGVLQGAAAGGMGAQIPGLMKSFADSEKAGADVQKTQAQASVEQLKAAKAHQDAASGVLGSLLQNPNLTHQDIIAGVNQLVNAGHKTPQEGAEFVRSLPGDIRIARQMLTQAAMQGMTFKEQLDNQLKQAELGQGQQRIGLQQQDINLRQSQQNSGVTYQTDANGNLIALPTKTNGISAPIGQPVMGPDGQPIGGNKAKLTEDQGKATSWLVQANNAFNNMQKVASANPEATKPGLADAVAAIPGMGAIGNSFRSADRQKFNQGASSLSEALLRAATGAGMNQHEAEQKIREVTPVWGEKDESIQQKMQAIPLFIESLKVRAGPGAKQAEAIGGTTPKTVHWNDLK